MARSAVEDSKIQGSRGSGLPGGPGAATPASARPLVGRHARAEESDHCVLKIDNIEKLSNVS